MKAEKLDVGFYDDEEVRANASLYFTRAVRDSRAVVLMIKEMSFGRDAKINH